jgi:hypothetical protein
MAADKQGDQNVFNHRVLADDHLAHFLSDAADGFLESLYPLAYFRSVGWRHAREY